MLSYEIKTKDNKMSVTKRIQVPIEIYQQFFEIAGNNDFSAKNPKERIEKFFRDGLIPILNSSTETIDSLEQQLSSSSTFILSKEQNIRINKLQILEVLPSDKNELIEKLLNDFIKNNKENIEAAMGKI